MTRTPRGSEPGGSAAPPGSAAWSPARACAGPAPALANIARDDQRSQRGTDDRVAAIAVQIARQLGEMKGAAMKIGQVLSTVDLPGSPEDGRRSSRPRSPQLRDNAPTFGVQRHPQGRSRRTSARSIEDAFAEFDQEAFAAASIGQVHRATTHDGEEVAVKVQYPGVAEAVEVDLRNLHLILPLVKRMAPGLDVKAVGGSFASGSPRSSTTSSRRRTIARSSARFRGHPFVVVPRVHTALSGRRVLVTDYLEGARFDAVKEMDEATATATARSSSASSSTASGR